MESNCYEQSYIGNAIRSLFKLIILVEENTHLCHIIDYDKEIHNLSLEEANTFDILCNRIYKNIHPEDRESFNILTDVDSVHEKLSKKVSISAECRIRHSNSRYYWTTITICNAKIENSAQGKEYLFLLEDIHKQKLKEKAEIHELLSTISRLEGEYADLFTENMTDQQTGCYNRKGLVYFENQIIEEARKNDKALFVCVLDINGLKHINDTYGHKYGDEAIKAVSSALKEASPVEAKIIRTGGDEFLVLAAIDKATDPIPEFAAKIESALKNYNEEHNNTFQVNASYGIVVTTDHNDISDLDKYIEIADQKMYEMKEKTDPYKR